MNRKAGANPNCAGLTMQDCMSNYYWRYGELIAYNPQCDRQGGGSVKQGLSAASRSRILYLRSGAADKRYSLGVKKMRIVIAFVFLTLFSPAYSAEMQLLPSEEAHCLNWDSYCYEWKFTRDKTLRFIAHGDEDGGLWMFFRITKSGKYKKLFEVHPALIDSKRPGSLFFGYAWDIEDIVIDLKSRDIKLQVTFDHNFRYDGNVAPNNQRATPYVLFRGTSTQPDIKVQESLTFSSMTPAQIIRRVTVN